MHLPNLLRKALIFTGAIALLILLFGGWAMASNYQATRRAERFCAGISIGEPVTNVISRAKQEKGIIVVDDSPFEVVFIFHGFVFAHATCHAEVQNGAVITKKHFPARD
jgi:hypothetical protein